jgi:phosphotriesterase-related protein
MVSRDETFDFGLDPGERFEPEEEPEEPFDLALPHVMTVLGPVEPDDLGFTLPHEHLIRRRHDATASDPDLMLDDPARAVAELEDAYNAGLRAIVDLTTGDDGRDAGDLLWIAQRSPVNVIAVTGHRSAASESGDATVEEIAGRFIRELTAGIEGTAVKAGAIAAGEERVLRAAAQAHLATGAPVATLTDRGTMAAEQIAILREEGVDPSRVIVGDLDVGLGETGLRSVLDAGAFVLLDQIGSPDAADKERAAMVRALVAGGNTGQLLLSSAVSRRSRLKAYGGGPGWSYPVEEFPLLLMEAGVDAPTVARLFVDNPARALTIRR